MRTNHFRKVWQDVRGQKNSLRVYLGGSFFFALVFLVIVKFFLNKSLTITTHQEYFFEVEKNMGVEIPQLSLSGYWNFIFSLVWSVFILFFSKFKILERNELIRLPALNFVATAMGIYLSFYLNAILFGAIAYIGFILIYVSLVVVLEISEIIWDVFFPD